ncbi:MAG: DUF547 domain-containing protein [Saprospiraceae bacterium]
MKVFFFFLLLSCHAHPISKLDEKPINYIQASTDFVMSLKNHQDVEIYIKIFEKANFEQLQMQLGEDSQKLTFWINIYNGYIIYILRKNPELYENRRDFFKNKQIEIAGESWSFSDIEHGIIRGSQHEYFLGYMKKWFPKKRERQMRVKNRDYRIHFALNCGAKSCPPVVVYQIDRLDQQLNQSTERYLTKNTTYDMESKIVKTTTLFSWFRGDFGGKKGIKKKLLSLNLIPDKDVKLAYMTYDWTLDLTQFVDN